MPLLTRPVRTVTNPVATVTKMPFTPSYFTTWQNYVA